VTTALLRSLAEANLIARTRFYRAEGGDGLGERFFDAAVAALGALTRMPRTGSPHVGEFCGIPGLRVRRVIGFPCGWYYLTSSGGYSCAIEGKRQPLAYRQATGRR
jgi:hypothetical protein